MAWNSSSKFKIILPVLFFCAGAWCIFSIWGPNSKPAAPTIVVEASRETASEVSQPTAPAAVAPIEAAPIVWATADAVKTPSASPIPQKENPPKKSATHFLIQKAAVSAEQDVIVPDLIIETPVEENTTSVIVVESTPMPATKVESPVAPEEEEPEEEKISSGLVKDFWLWGGWGPSFTSVNQTVPGLSNIDFAGLGSSATSLNGGFWLSDDFGLNLSYRDSPGEAKSSQTVAVSNGKYHWRTATVEGLVRTDRDLSATSAWNFRLGFQQTQLPFLVPLSSSALDVTEASMTNLTLGVEYKTLLREKLRFEWLFRYQQPLGSSADLGAKLKVKPKASFETSLGAAYEFSQNAYLGVYWYNQYQNFSFDYDNNVGTAFSGTQSTFISTFDLRLGFEF